MPDITGVNHLSLTVTDLQRSEEWYSQVLGLSRLMAVDDDGSGHGFVVMIHPPSSLVIGLHTHKANPGEPFTETRTGLDHVGFMVESRQALDEWTARFDELGVPYSPITDAPYGGVLVFRDPDNIQLEMFSWPG